MPEGLKTNGCAERVQGTILEECWKPCLGRYLVPGQNCIKFRLAADLLRFAQSKIVHYHPVGY